jgi:hypothetical protein
MVTALSFYSGPLLLVVIINHVYLLKLKIMKVKELIELLQNFDQDKTVILRHDDHTDWTYTTELDSTSIDEDDWYDEDSDTKENVVVIDCRFW